VTSQPEPRRALAIFYGAVTSGTSAGRVAKRLGIGLRNLQA
jgi:hypothetical protein